MRLAVLVALLAACLTLPFCAAGCAGFPGGPPSAQAQAVASRLEANRARIAELETLVTPLPPGDPARTVYEAELRQRRAIEQAAPYVQAATRPVNVDDPLWTDLAVLVPGGASILALLRIWQKERNRRAESEQALLQTIEGVDAAFPEKTPEQKLKLAAAQDRSVQATVAKARKGTIAGKG